MDLLENIKIAQQKLGENLFSCFEIKYELHDGSNVLRVVRNDNKITINYGELSMLFRGLSLIKEHINEEKFDISLTKRFTKNGFMVDCSRNGVINMATLKEIVLTQALMGQNRLLLYTEDTYKLEKYRWFGYLRGGYTKEELKEIVEYGKGFGVELIPCIQTLGHLGRPLHWEEMIPLRDGPTTLLIDDEKVYEFIEEMIKFSKECFNSKEIHIGMDESTEIGLGRYLGKHPFTERVGLFCKHLARVIKICQKYDFTPMIWSDMFFRLNSEDEEYYRDTPLPQSTIDLIPEDIELVYWDYYHDKKEIYDRMNDYHLQTKRPVIFAGGSWRWKGYAPSIQKTLEFSNEALLSCVDKNVKSVFVTAWGDNGNECSIFTTLPAIALYSTFDYYGHCDNKLISSLLEAVSGETLDRMLLMDLPDMPDKKVLVPMYNPSKFFLFQDPFNGLFEKQVKPQFKANYEEFVKTLKLASEESKNYGYIYETLSLLCDVLIEKYDLGVRLREAYKNNNKDNMKKISESIPSLIGKLDALNNAHRRQWFKENTMFGFDVCDGRIGYLKNRLNSVSVIINEYLNKNIDRIEELETEILPYNGHDYEVCWNWWATTVTVHNL